MNYRESALLGMAHKAEHDLKGTCPLVEDEAIVWAVEMIDRYREALQQAEMDMGVIWMALPPKERETLRIARDRILRVLEVGGGG